MGIAEDRLALALPLAPDIPTLGQVLAHQVDLIHRAGPDWLREWKRTRGLGELDAEHAIAREHGFRDWAHALEHGDRLVDRRFEDAADAIVKGDAAGLRRLVDEDARLVHARSPYGHRATLLNHVAANGIETARQWQTPACACEIARVLLEGGADPDATCECYGHPDTTLTLLVSSCHPAEAGVQADLVEVLCRAGARIDGPDDDGGPLWTAIVWGYGAAAEALARRGARVDNLVFAAALDDIARVDSLLGSQERPRSAQRIGTHGPAIDPDRMLEYATFYAAGLGRRRAVEHLLARNPDLSVEEPIYGATALSIARYEHPAAGRPNGSPDLVALLERWIADRAM
jgi:hypothetical protein